MSDPRRVSDDLLIQLIREVRHDAEIGVRLGVSAGEVRERKRALRQRLGEQRYAEVLNASTKKWTPPWKRRWVVALVALVSVVGLLLVVANLLVPEDEPIAAVRTVPTSTPQPSARPAQVLTHDGVRFRDAGQFLTTASGSDMGSLGTPDYRPGLAVFTLRETGYIVPSETARWEPSGGGRGELRLRAQSLNGSAVNLRLNPGHSATRIRTIRTDVGAIAEVYSQVGFVQPILFVRAYDDSGRQLVARITDDGYLEVSEALIPEDWAIDALTGRRIEGTDPADAVATVRLFPGVGAFTTCDTTGGALRCHAVIQRAQGAELLVDGPVTCPDPTTIRLSLPDKLLEFSRGFTATPATEDSCRESTWNAGQYILASGEWSLFALKPDRGPLSLAITAGGDVVTGEFSVDLSCPCLPAP